MQLQMVIFDFKEEGTGNEHSSIYSLELRATVLERRESEDTHEKSIFLLFRQNIPLGELI